jgi:phosphoribosylamine--glycine ligase
MKVLVIGGGGREHALAWKIAQDSSKPQIYCAPGNAGTAALGTNLAIDATDTGSLLAWAREVRPDLTVVGPEAPLCAGLTNAFEADGLRVFGPSMAAARLEGSKIFAKEIMQAAGVPTAASDSFTEVEPALVYLEQVGVPVVIKADGLAAGKGVTVCGTVALAEAAIREALEGRVFGDAGSEVLVEECLFGEEASILALIDGEHVEMLASSQDHKRALDGDHGPNTGGMGAYSPAPVVTDDLWPIIRDEVFGRTLAELKKRGIVYRGVLYAGIMVTPEGPKVLEFNCRFGDPETQVVLPRWDGDILPAFMACANGTLDQVEIKWKPEACATVVMASGGYPGSYAKGRLISGLAEADAMDQVQVFHAGTKKADGGVVTSGGRVLGVTGWGDNLKGALDRAYGAVDQIHFEDAIYRKDIGWRALRAR